MKKKKKMDKVKNKMKDKIEMKKIDYSYYFKLFMNIISYS